MTIIHLHHVLSSWKEVKGREVFTPLGLWNVSLVDYVSSLHSVVTFAKWRLTEVYYCCCKPIKVTDRLGHLQLRT